ncbi:chromosome segregation protein [Desulfohalotomaculum tongense]|nr:chromosome segregation protein [Desulforadius tongensis]
MLKRLDIQGFKSFANKVQIEFNPGLTVIVGPNGSGKSNISDAINWALGEHRASALRGARMDDVIFAGSDNRRKLGMCEVSVILDNSKNIFPLEYSEVTVTRRIFRSGESQYMINKVPCRLKDIHNLLVDTGVGKGAYAIIGQGKVEEILHSRPEERRSVIEEAAGIVKYRRRKEEALRKLTHTEHDLARLGDIILELSERLEPLAAEAKKAEQWREYVSERRRLELGLLARELAAVEEKLTVLGEQLKKIDRYEQHFDRQAAGKVSQLERQLEEKNAQVEQYRVKLDNLCSEIQRVENQLLLAGDRQQNLKQEYGRILKNKEEAENKLRELERDKQQERAKLQEIKLSVNPRESELQQMQQRLEQLEGEIRNRERALEEDKARVIELMNESAQGKAKLQRAEERKTAAERRLTQLRQSAQDAALEQSRLKDRLKQAKKEIEQLNKEIAEKQQQLVKAEQLRSELNQKLYRCQEDVRRKREELFEAKSRYRVLQESQEAYAGYQRGVREVLLALKMGKADLKGICGTVAELIQTPAEYELAVETALGGAVQNIVTCTDTDAQRVIDYLKKNRLGRVTFLPLSTLRPARRHPDEINALAMPGVVGVAADLVQCQPRYRVVKEFLLGKVLVVENIHRALKVARATGQRLRLVTLDGEYLHPGGSITGGSSTAQTRGLLKVKREKNEYAAKISKLQREEKELKQVEEKLQAELNQLEQQIDELRDNVVKYQVSLAGKNQELQQLEDAVARFGYHSQESSYEINNLEEEIKNQDEVQVSAARQVAEADNKLKLVQRSIKEKQRQLVELKEKQRGLQQKITSTRVELAGVEQQEAGIVNLINRLTQDINSCRRDIKTCDNELLSLQQKEKQLQQEIKSKEHYLGELKQQQQIVESSLQQKKDEQDEISRALEQARQQVKQLEEEEQKRREQVHKIQLQQARLETEKQALLERMERDYNVSSGRDLQVHPVKDAARCKKRITELKALIEQMGPVNPAAEEEYKKVQERYTYLLQQKKDLDESKDSLQNLITEMDRLMASKFTSTFKNIQREFSKIFKELFGGGSASLNLVGDNPLTAGIDIEARPPGKKLQNIGLLSGGERSLTAIALLFAILKVSPSPFCILDEIDAALDESNVDRFADFLLKFSQTMQFVVISHRKGTMERAETLYGVTMGSTGTSKVFSIRMSQAEAAAAKN